MFGNWRDDPFDIQSSNSELCLDLRRNAVYFTTEMLLPALITSIITISSVPFQISIAQLVPIALSLLAQIIALTLINSRLPTFAIHTPTISYRDHEKRIYSNMTTKSQYSKIVFSEIYWIQLHLMISMILWRLSKSNTAIPLHHSLNQFAYFINNRIALPLSSEEINEDSQRKYAPLACALNNLTFLIFLALYFVVFVGSFIL
ncbi:unnamed protein product [Cercopithifilaria johnstoni]|uniref:Uncharacterized protein n=1 Tax=Cercopithifilaria johnstoni TaxID=2874296 RepID=A0A8J2M7R7_9BILA|nr:unnamed protein product [Cercopithifilaria johnstoni]